MNWHEELASRVHLMDQPCELVGRCEHAAEKGIDRQTLDVLNSDVGPRSN